MNASGIIGVIKPRKITHKGQALTAYSFTLEDRDDDRWFGTWTTPPPEVGVYAEFEYSVNAAGFNNVDNDTMTVTEPETVGASTGLTAVPATLVSVKAEEAFKKADNKDAKLTWQSARFASIQLLEVAVAAGALDLGTGKKGSKLDALLIQVNRQTVDFFEYSMEVGRTGDAPEDLTG